MRARDHYLLPVPSMCKPSPIASEDLSIPTREWWVFVHAPGVGYIGTVTGSTEELARLAALSKYSKEGERGRLAKRLQMRRPETMHIYEDDAFDVRSD